MTMVSEVMTRNVITIGPHDSACQAGAIMRRLRIAALPVCDGDELLGMVTDRDIDRVMLPNGGALVEVKDISTHNLPWCFDDDDVSVVEEEMARRHLHRVPVLDHNKRLIGILSSGDIARNHFRHWTHD